MMSIIGGFNMKEIALLAVLVLVLGGARLEAGPERGGSGAGREWGLGLIEDDECTRIHFKAEYESPIGGFLTCEGFRIVTRDSEQCTMTDLSTFPPGIYRGTPTFHVNGSPYHWNSDYDGVTALKLYVVVSDNGDGTGHLYIDAHY
jgi:hypothetical protein